MKTKHLSLLVAAGGLLCGSRHLMAQDPAPPPSPPPSAGAPQPPPSHVDDNADANNNARPKSDNMRAEEHGRHHHEEDRHGPDRHGPEMKATPFIGVLTRTLAPEVRAQTGLAEGFGLLVEDVLPDSPAKAAGLLQHDVLVMLGDQRLVNTEQLAVLVRSNAKDSDIVFTLKRAGAEQKVTVKVGEKMMPALPPEGPGRWPGMHPGMGFDGQRFGQDLRENMHEFQERMQDWSRGPRERSAPPGHGPQGSAPHQDHGLRPEADKTPPPPPAGGKDAAAPRSQTSTSTSVQVDGTGNVVSSSSQSSNASFERNVTRRDKTGEYSLCQEGNEKIFTAKPLDGQEQTFTVTTDEQRNAVPEAFKEKLKGLDEVSRQVKASATDAAPAATPENAVRTTTI
ncbi:MAG: hypothetical protein JWO94_2984 [Verrucomicrobiaceae bacterium]|nr:hypothetical protein [Verrucomicrobiaceae bacterium]